MPVEIERKFLIDQTKWIPSGEGFAVEQAYLSVFPSPTVRIRITPQKSYLTIKGRGESITRPEFEYEIPNEEARELMKLATSEEVKKMRYIVHYKGMKWEIDVFKGRNEGLVLAEIELETEDQHFEKPDWILDEVTGDRRYYNSYLSVHPFQEWER